MIARPAHHARVLRQSDRFHTSPHGDPLLAATRSVVAGGTIGVVKVRDVIRRLESEGWLLVVTKGSHRQFKHPRLIGRVTVSGALGADVPLGTLASIERQARLRLRPR